jgi:hypothetical protein
MNFHVGMVAIAVIAAIVILALLNHLAFGFNVH